MCSKLLPQNPRRRASPFLDRGVEHQEHSPNQLRLPRSRRRRKFSLRRSAVLHRGFSLAPANRKRPTAAANEARKKCLFMVIPSGGSGALNVPPNRFLERTNGTGPPNGRETHFFCKLNSRTAALRTGTIFRHPKRARTARQQWSRHIQTQASSKVYNRSHEKAFRTLYLGCDELTYLSAIVT